MEFPTNEQLPRKRLLSLIRKMRNSPGLMKRYDQEIQDHVRRGFIELVEAEKVSILDCHYLPHRPVFREDKTTTKMRIVFDTSTSTSRQPSLNDCLEAVPNFVPELMKVILRFRTHRVALTADVEKAFLQISLAKEERDFVRFL